MYLYIQSVNGEYIVAYNHISEHVWWPNSSYHTSEVMFKYQAYERGIKPITLVNADKQMDQYVAGLCGWSQVHIKPEWRG